MMRGWPVKKRDLKCPQCGRSFQRVWNEDAGSFGTCNVCKIDVKPYDVRPYRIGGRKVKA